MMNLPRQSSSSWYRDRLREKQQELCHARTRLEKLSEESDVFFALSRAKHDGHPVGELPCPTVARHVPVYAYMLAKYTSR